MSIQFVLCCWTLLEMSELWMCDEREKKKEEEDKEERIITLPVVSSNEGASTVFFTPNKRFILVRESLFCLSNTLIVVRTRCLRKNKKKKKEENFGATLLLWHSWCKWWLCVNFFCFFSSPVCFHHVAHPKRPTRFFVSWPREKTEEEEGKRKKILKSSLL